MTDVAAPEATPSLGAKVLGGFAWSIVMVVVLQLCRVVFGITLARLLTPSQYGLAGMALVFSSLVLSFSDLSMGSGLVQRKSISEADRSTVFWTSAGVGLLLTSAGVALSGPLAAFYHQPRVAPLFAVVSITFFLISLQVTQASLLQRDMRFRVLTLRIAVANVIGGVVSITLAALGTGPWAIILSQICTTGTSTILLWTYSSWRPRLAFSLTSLRQLGGFGLNLLGARTASYLNRNADNLLVGRFLGSTALGAYSVAYNIMLLPLGQVIIPIQEVLFPAYSRWQDDRKQVAQVYLRVVRVVAAVVGPAMVGVALISHDFVRVVLGERWLAAAPVLAVLAPVAFVQSLSGLGDRVLTALDRTRLIRRFTTLESVLTVPAFALGLHWGILGVAVCYAAVNTPLQLVYIWLTLRALGLGVSDFVRSFAGVIEAVLAMSVACLLVHSGLTAANVDLWQRLGIEVLVSALVFIPLCGFWQPEVVREVRSLRHIRSAASVA